MPDGSACRSAWTSPRNVRHAHCRPGEERCVMQCAETSVAFKKPLAGSFFRRVNCHCSLGWPRIAWTRVPRKAADVAGDGGQAMALGSHRRQPAGGGHSGAGQICLRTQACPNPQGWPVQRQSACWEALFQGFGPPLQPRSANWLGHLAFEESTLNLGQAELSDEQWRRRLRVRPSDRPTIP